MCKQTLAEHQHPVSCECVFAQCSFRVYRCVCVCVFLFVWLYHVHRGSKSQIVPLPKSSESGFLVLTHLDGSEVKC